MQKLSFIVIDNLGVQLPHFIVMLGGRIVSIVIDDPSKQVGPQVGESVKHLNEFN